MTELSNDPNVRAWQHKQEVAYQINVNNIIADINRYEQLLKLPLSNKLDKSITWLLNRRARLVAQIRANYNEDRDQPQTEPIYLDVEG